MRLAIQQPGSLLCRQPSRQTPKPVRQRCVGANSDAGRRVPAKEGEDDNELAVRIGGGCENRPFSAAIARTECLISLANQA